MTTPALRDRLRAALNQRGHASPPAVDWNVTSRADLSILGGHWFESDDGPGYLIESRYEAGHAHGLIPLHRALTVDTGVLAGQVRDPRLAECPPSSLLFVDTETTGLGGAGAMVFLAGVARFEGSDLVLRQYLLPAPEYEGGLLGGLHGQVEAAAALVSYNGKSFDVPLLESRYILARRTPTLRCLPHLDLLHPNRRLFRGDVESHRLTVIERELLGFEREADCPSSEVPLRYFRFQRSGDPTYILPVLRHNAWDVLSLVALAAHLGAICAGDEQPLQAARAAEYAGDLERALHFYQAAYVMTSGRAQRLETCEHAARTAARLGRHAEAARWWRILLAEPRSRRIIPFVELAKLLEHNLSSPAEALALVDRAIDLVRCGLLPQGPGECALSALEKRQARLAARIRARSPAERPGPRS